MSIPPPAASRAPSSASRYFFVLLVGLVMGVIGAVMAMRALNARRDHVPEGVMHVMGWHAGKLKDNAQQNRCGATDTLPHLQALRLLANDIEPVFGKLADDQRFKDHAANFRGTLDTALATPPLNCAGVGTTASKIGEGCKACHQDFNK